MMNRRRVDGRMIAAVAVVAGLLLTAGCGGGGVSGKATDVLCSKYVDMTQAEKEQVMFKLADELGDDGYRTRAAVNASGIYVACVAEPESTLGKLIKDASEIGITRTND